VGAGREKASMGMGAPGKSWRAFERLARLEKRRERVRSIETEEESMEVAKG